MSFSFDRLPEELKIRILQDLDAKSLLQCKSTCRYLRQIVQCSSALQYIIELGLHGLHDTGSGLPHSQLIELLRKQQKAWEDFTWKKATVIPFTEHLGCVACEYLGGVLGIAGSHELTFVTLRSSFDGDNNVDEGAEVPQWKISRWVVNEFAMKNFAFDPSQDFVVLLEDIESPLENIPSRTVNIHLRTMSGNEPHPLGTRSALSFVMEAIPSTDLTAMYNCVVQVVDDVVALFFCRGESFYFARVLLWNWKKGITIYDSDSVAWDLPPSPCDFTLLTRTTFVLASRHNQGSLHLFTFSPTSKNTVPWLQAVFLLPDTKPRYCVQELWIHTGSFQALPSPRDLFAPKAGDGALVMAVKYKKLDELVQETGRHAFCIYTHSNMLLKYASSAERRRAQQGPNGEEAQAHVSSCGAATDDATEMKADVRVAWNIWGPANTRLLRGQTTTEWPRHVHGQRSVVPGVDESEVLICDLAPVLYTSPIPSLSLTSSTGSLSPASNMVSSKNSFVHEQTVKKTNFAHTKPSEARHGYLFTDRITTRLPICITKLSMPAFEGIDTWMTDGERAIAIKTHDQTNKVSTVLVYSL